MSEKVSKILHVVIITVIPLILAFLRMLNPELKIDWLTVTLIIVASIPWLSPILKSLEIPGKIKIEFRDVKEAVEKVIGTPELAKLETEPQKEEKTIPLDLMEPNLALVSLRIEIEKRIRKLAQRHDIDSSRRSLANLLAALRQSNILPYNVTGGLQELVVLGNSAAHGADVSIDAAEWAIKEGPKVLYLLDKLLEEKK